MGKTTTLYHSTPNPQFGILDFRSRFSGGKRKGVNEERRQEDGRLGQEQGWTLLVFITGYTVEYYTFIMSCETKIQTCLNRKCPNR